MYNKINPKVVKRLSKSTKSKSQVDEIFGISRKKKKSFESFNIGQKIIRIRLRHGVKVLHGLIAWIIKTRIGHYDI